MPEDNQNPEITPAKAAPVNRFDSLGAKDWMSRSFSRTPEGFLTGRAIVTNIGVFTYRDADGTTHTEARLPEEVFARDSLETLKLKPVTNDHPKELVTTENVKKLQVGSLGSNPSSTAQLRNYEGWTPEDQLTDGLHVAIDMTINDPGAIEDVLNGKRELSCGYNCDLEMAPEGFTFLGMPVNFIQRNIRYNHVAIVDAARAGSNASLRLDSGDAVQVRNDKVKEASMPDNLKKITLDGVEFQAEPQVLQALSQATQRADAAEKSVADSKAQLSSLEAERDSLKEKLDAKEKELEEAKAAAMDPARVDAAAKEIMALHRSAERAKVEVKDGMTHEDVKKAVITSVFPSAKLDGKDSVYIQARYDAAVEELDAIEAAGASQRQTLSGVSPEGTETANSDSAQDDPDAARKRYVDSLKKDSRETE